MWRLERQIKGYNIYILLGPVYAEKDVGCKDYEAFLRYTDISDQLS